MNGKSEMQWNAEEQAPLVKEEQVLLVKEARRGEITETVAIPQLERIDGQTASSFLLLTFLLRKKKRRIEKKDRKAPYILTTILNHIVIELKL